MKVYRVNIGPKPATGVVYEIRPGDDRFTGRAVVDLAPVPCPHCAAPLDSRTLVLAAGQAALDAGAREIAETTPPERFTTEMMRLRSVRQDVARAERDVERHRAEAAAAEKRAAEINARTAEQLEALSGLTDQVEAVRASLAPPPAAGVATVADE